MNEVEGSLFNVVSCNNTLVQAEIAAIIQDSVNISVIKVTIRYKLLKLGITRRKIIAYPNDRNNCDK